jgi:hypothetical protein
MIRTPANRPFVAIVTSEDLVGTNTHYYHNRTTPCEGDACPICAEGHSWRWHGYLSCVDQGTKEHVLFEFTAQASDAFRAYRDRYSTLRGCLFKATRHAQRYNGRVTIQTRPADLEGKDLPPGANLKAMLCHIWNVALPEADILGTVKDHPRIRVRKSLTPKGNSQPVT